MFWGLVLEPFKKYTQKVDQTFHISQAALDLKSCVAEPIQLVVEYENSNFVLATLSKKDNIFQVPLDLIFKTGDQVSFRTIGNGKVHLSGYHVLEDLDSVIMNGEEESDVDESEELPKGKGKRKKTLPNVKGGKKAKLDDTNEDKSDDDFDEEEDDDFDEEDEGSEDENVTVESKAGKKKQKGTSFMLSMDEDEDDDDDDDDNDDDDEDDEDEEEDMDEEEDDEEMDFDEMSDDSEEISAKLDDSSKKKNKKGQTPQTPNGLATGPKGQDKSAQKLNKSLKESTPKKEVKTPKSEKKQKSEKKLGSVENTPQRKNSEGQKKEEKTPKSPKNDGSPQKKVLEGGVISEEITVGNGPVAKPGKMANVYYVGTLASTKKEFDSVKSGGGFKFRIGRNEVIKGWDIGLIGMKVGGKRKLTIPPHLAYGSKGSPPVIPPNSTLVFTVELKGLS